MTKINKLRPHQKAPFMKKIQFQLLLLLAVISFVTSCKKDIQVYTPAVPKFSTSNIDISGATYVTLSKAQEAAQTFLQNRFKGITINISSGETITKDGIPYLHIFNTAGSHGFVILAADSIYTPVLAYDSVRNFSINDLNGGLVQWINKHGHELDYLRKNKTAYTDSIIKFNKVKWNSLGTKSEDQPKYATTSAEPYPSLITSYSSTPISLVGPLCQTLWNQSAPWNQYCPVGTYSEGHTPSGCVPTAMAQIMYFWQYPQRYSYNTMVKYINQFDASTWPSVNPGGTTPGSVFMTGFATGQFTHYSDADGSGSNSEYIDYVFNQFGYSSAAETKSIPDQILSGAKNGTDYGGFLSDYITSSQTPCIVNGATGQNTILGLIYWPYTNGHSWVCDGAQKFQNTITYTYTYYTQTSWGWLPHTMITSGGSYNSSYVHMNWGWGGLNNGWYDCSVNYTNPAPGYLDFGYFQTINYDIHP